METPRKPSGRWPSLAHWSQQALRAHPRRPALAEQTRYRVLSLSYGELDRRVQRCRRVLAERGLRQGDRVVLMGPNGPDWATAFLACLQSGLVSVPLDPASPDAFLRVILEQTAASLVLRPRPTPLVESLSFAQLCAAGERLPEDPLPLAPVGPEDLAEIVYTSGTTGSPKGVMLSHGNLCADLEAVTQAVKFPVPMRFLSSLPLSHMLEQMGGLFTPLHYGCCVVYPFSLLPSRMIRTIRSQRIHGLITVPGLLRGMKGLLERDGRARRALGWQFRLIGVGGAALPADLEDWWSRRGVLVVQGYGLTETAPILATNTLLRKRRGSVGRVLPGVKVRIGEAGEILAQGRNATAGYYRAPEKTAELFAQDGWLRTGDLGEIKDGWLYVRGRLKEVIISESGANVYPEDVEAELDQAPGVRDSCVVQWHDKVWAVLLLEPGVSPQAVIRDANQRLMGHQKVAGFTLWPQGDFPRTQVGKVRKFEVLKTLAELEQGQAPAGAPAASGSRLERIAAQVLGGKPVSAEAKLGELGLDSLGRLELLSRIEAEFAVVLEDSAIGEATTVKELEEMVSRHPGGQVRQPPSRPWAGPAELPRRALRWLPKLVVRSVTRPRGEGLQHLEGLPAPAIFAANHQSAWDGALVHDFLPRRFRRCAFAVLPDLYGGSTDPGQLPPVAWRAMGAFISAFYCAYPFGPAVGMDRSLELTGSLLDRGFSLLVFPEGGRSPDGRVHRFLGGIGVLAREMRLPVVPVRIEGMHEVLPYPRFVFPRRRGGVRVSFGAPLRFDPTWPVEQAAARIQQAVESL